LFHISNRFIRLDPVLIKVAEESKAWMVYKITSGQPFGIPSAWAVFTWNEMQFRFLVMNQQWDPIAYRIRERHRVWTDGYSNILPVLDFQKIKRSFLNFKLASDF